MHRSSWLVVGLWAALGGCGSNSNGDEQITGGVPASATGATGEDSATTSETMGEASSGEAGGDGGGTCQVPESGSYADCVNRSASACMNEDAGCLVNSLSEPAWGVCFLSCQEDCDCWGAPEAGTAIPRCAAALSMGGSACILDCGGDRACPEGMRCLGINGETRACVYDLEGLGDGTTGDGDGSTGNGTTGDGDGSTSDGSTGDGTTSGASSSGSGSGSSGSSGTTTGGG